MKEYLVQFVTGRQARVWAHNEDEALTLAQAVLQTTAAGLVTALRTISTADMLASMLRNSSLGSTR